MAYLAVAIPVAVIVFFAWVLGIRYHKRRLERQDAMRFEYEQSEARRAIWEEEWAEADRQEKAEQADEARKAEFLLILDTGTL